MLRGASQAAPGGMTSMSQFAQDFPSFCTESLASQDPPRSRANWDSWLPWIQRCPRAMLPGDPGDLAQCVIRQNTALGQPGSVDSRASFRRRLLQNIQRYPVLFWCLPSSPGHGKCVFLPTTEPPKGTGYRGPRGLWGTCENLRCPHHSLRSSVGES